MKSIEKRRRSDGKQFLFNQTFVYVFFIKQYQEISFESDVILLIEFSTVIERSNFRSIVSYPVNIQRNLVKPHKTVKSIEKRSEPFPLGGAAVRLADPRRRLSASASISIDFVAGTRTSTAADKVHRFSLHYDRFPPGLLPVFFTEFLTTFICLLLHRTVRVRVGATFFLFVCRLIFSPSPAVGFPPSAHFVDRRRMKRMERARPVENRP